MPDRTHLGSGMAGIDGLGSGMAGIDCLATGNGVTAEQMRALFGAGLHPSAELRQEQLEGPGLIDATIKM
jgi:hypothetical protein